MRRPDPVPGWFLRAMQRGAGACVFLLVVCGSAAAGETDLLSTELPSMRLHLRAILRDDLELFVGSQGLRSIELDRRRELGIIVRDRTAIKQFRGVFDDDWATTKSGREERKERKAA